MPFFFLFRHCLPSCSISAVHSKVSLVAFNSGANTLLITGYRHPLLNSAISSTLLS
ncbi:hypothetical protein BMETH_2237_0 [methanotrophic bacterial endosymbiont of Bathymodiolus sp.]|nr:hypothetical protein BMETH_2237_0 [methanotrophic bacterial endosymbiont of Bathymodiolus sp.]